MLLYTHQARTMLLDEQRLRRARVWPVQFLSAWRALEPLQDLTIWSREYRRRHPKQPVPEGVAATCGKAAAPAATATAPAASTQTAYKGRAKKPNSRKGKPCRFVVQWPLFSCALALRHSPTGVLCVHFAQQPAGVHAVRARLLSLQPAVQPRTLRSARRCSVTPLCTCVPWRS